MIAALESRWSVITETPRTSRRVYLDTADWRAYSAGLAIELDRGAASSNGSTTLSVREQDTSLLLASESVAGPPVFACDLPQAGSWTPLKDTIGDRRLLFHVEALTHTQRVRVQNSAGKTTAVVAFEGHTIGSATAPRRLVRLATVGALRGYEATGDRIATVLVEAGLVPQTTPLTALARSLLALPAPGPPPGPAVPLQRSTLASPAIATVLGRLRQQLLMNEGGVRDRLDQEFLHESRVAVRRARSVVGQAKDYLPPAAASLASELRWLASLTGPARDLDVYLAQLDEAGEPDLAPLGRHLRDRRDQHQRSLVEAMDSSRYRVLLQSWEALADGQLPWGGTSAPAGVAVGEAADHLIARAHRRVVRRGRAIGDSSPAAALHDLRKRAKALRYLLECFSSLYPEAERAASIRELKALQDNLGEFQDCEVQASTLQAMADDMFAANAAPASTLMAMGRLGQQLEERRARARAEFRARFARFSSPTTTKLFATLVVGTNGATP